MKKIGKKFDLDSDSTVSSVITRMKKKLAGDHKFYRRSDEIVESQRAKSGFDPFKKDELKRCRAILGQEPLEEPDNIEWQDCFKDSDNHPERCPICGKRLVTTATIKPTGMIPHPGVPPVSSDCFQKIFSNIRIGFLPAIFSLSSFLKIFGA